LVGPSQVGARFIEMLVARYHHPIWTLITSTSAVALGLGLLLAGFPALSLGLVLYGGGVGLSSIARGTLPLALFGASGYATLMGRLAMPNLMAQAISPLLGALLLEHGGAGGTLLALTILAAVNVALSGILWLSAGSRAGSS
jgi:hypothetical protein